MQPNRRPILNRRLLAMHQLLFLDISNLNHGLNPRWQDLQPEPCQSTRFVFSAVIFLDMC